MGNSLRGNLIRLAHDRPELREHLLPLLKEGSLAGTYADFVYRGEQLFLQAAAKLIKKAAGGHAERVDVIRQGGRAPFLVYEGQDRSDLDLELTFMLITLKMPDVKLSWFGKGVMVGNIDGDQTFKWGTLTPDAVLRVFLGQFGR